MSVYGMLRTGVAGMAAQASRLGSVADNIANTSTTGYKASDVQFSTLVIGGGSSGYVSGGVESHTRHLISQQGTFNFTASATDLAIRGEGFFVVTAPDGQFSLTRAGSFVPDETGTLVNASGFTLMGYPGDSAANVVVNGTAGLEPVVVDPSALTATPSTQGQLRLNMPADAPITPAGDLPSANVFPSSEAGKASMVVYGDLGEEVIVDIYTAKSAAGTWEVAVYDAAGRSADGGFPYAAGPIATETLTFGTDGQLDAASSTTVTIPVPGGQPFTLDMTGTSQLAAEFSVRDVDANGSSPSSVVSVEISADGNMTAVYENGTIQTLYTIPLATVVSVDKLEPLAGNVFGLTQEAGELRVGQAEQAGLGTVVSGALENSNVDLAGELTTMIESQRNYTANSKVFQTGSELIDVLVNLKR